MSEMLANVMSGAAAAQANNGRSDSPSIGKSPGKAAAGQDATSGLTPQ